jgi:hypothetical protein
MINNAMKIYSHNSVRERPIDASRSPPEKVSSYAELVERVGKIAYHNNGYFLFYRGQDCDYQTHSKSNSQSRIIASIYRPSCNGAPLADLLEPLKKKYAQLW